MPTKSKAGQKSYQELRQELDEVIVKLQDPNCDVDGAAQYFEQAVEAIKALEKHLEKAENRIMKVKVTTAPSTETPEVDG